MPFRHALFTLCVSTSSHTHIDERDPLRNLHAIRISVPWVIIPLVSLVRTSRCKEKGSMFANWFRKEDISWPLPRRPGHSEEFEVPDNACIHKSSTSDQPSTEHNAEHKLGHLAYQHWAVVATAIPPPATATLHRETQDPARSGRLWWKGRWLAGWQPYQLLTSHLLGLSWRSCQPDPRGHRPPHQSSFGVQDRPNWVLMG